MTTIPVDKELLEELIDLKLRFLHEEIDKILTRWKYKNPDKFLQDAKNGTIDEAESYAITLKQLLKEREDSFKLKSSWNDIN